jgi:hypothetical protein
MLVGLIFDGKGVRENGFAENSRTRQELRDIRNPIPKISTRFNQARSYIGSQPPSNNPPAP